MDVIINKETETVLPCLMLDPAGNLCLISKNKKGAVATQLQGSRMVDYHTKEIILSDYKPLPKGFKVELIN